MSTSERDGILFVYLNNAVTSEVTLFPVQKELTYFWQVEVSSGTVIPTVLDVSWNLEALVTVQQTEQNSTFFKITLLNNRTTIEDAAAMQLSFCGTFDNGDFTTITVSKKDELWSINMKRALLTLLQLKIPRIEEELSFIDEEAGIYGKCTVEYGVVDYGYKKVHKNVDHDSCKSMPIEESANCATNLCPSSYQVHTSFNHVYSFARSAFLQNKVTLY
uniref:Vitellogenin domain-containing protein n=1 Tax=Rhodnius prolixus TaxID=13249 RepID=T1HG10_RHOPR